MSRRSIIAILVVIFSVILSANYANSTSDASTQDIQIQYQESDFFKFLGPKKSGYPIIRTPKYGIQVQTNGLNSGRDHWIHDWEKKKKNGKIRHFKAYTPEYFLKQGADHMTEPFVEFASKMQDQEGESVSDGFVLRRVDEQFERMKNLYITCGGKWAVAATIYDPRKLFIEISDIPIWVPSQKVWAAGVKWSPYRIGVVGISANYIITNPPQAYLRKFDALVAWEVGNGLAESAGFRPRNINEEKGDRSPCGMSVQDFGLADKMPLDEHPSLIIP